MPFLTTNLPKIQKAGCHTPWVRSGVALQGVYGALVWLVILLSTGISATAAEESSLKALRAKDHQAISLAPEKIQVDATVLYHDPVRKLLYVHDGGGSVYTRIPMERQPALIPSGTGIRIEGITDPGLFMPCIDCCDAAAGWSLGELKPLPEAVSLAIKDAYDPRNSAMWVSLRGVVQRVLSLEGGPAMELQSGEGGIKVLFPAGSAISLPWQLVQAKVKVRGVLRSLSNRDRQLTGTVLMCPGMAHVEVEKNPALAFADLKRTPVAALNRYDQQQPERVRLLGRVTVVFPGEGLFLRDANSQSTPIWIQSAEPHGMQPGDYADVMGVAKLAAFRPELVATRLRPAETTPEQANAPSTEPISIDRNQALSAQFHHDFVEVAGRLIDHQDSQGTHTLVLETEGKLWQAEFRATTNRKPSPQNVSEIVPPVGSTLRVRGICQCIAYSEFTNHDQAGTFQLRLPSLSPEHLIVVATPPWFTLPRVLGMLGTAVAAALCIMAYSVLLRRRMVAQTQLIQQQMQLETLAKERMRIARDLHDDLGAGLTRISFLGAMALQQESKPEVKAHLQTIREASREVVRSLDATVWAVNPDKDAVNQLVTYLAHFAGELFKYTTIRCRLEIPENLPTHHLDARARHHTFLAVKEALNNAAKHSQATEVKVQVHVEPQPAPAAAHLVVTVEDNGVGFLPTQTAPTERHGQASMVKRMQDAGGTLVVHSQPGQGARLVFSLPIPDSHE